MVDTYANDTIKSLGSYMDGQDFGPLCLYTFTLEHKMITMAKVYFYLNFG